MKNKRIAIIISFTAVFFFVIVSVFYLSINFERNERLASCNDPTEEELVKDAGMWEIENSSTRSTKFYSNGEDVFQIMHGIPCGIGLFNTGFDAKTFKVIGDRGEFYIQESNKIYWGGITSLKNRSELKVVDTNIEDFSLLDDGSCGFAKDKKHVFFNGKIIENADGDTFEVLKLSDDSYCSSVPIIAKDRKNLFVFCESFQTIKRSIIGIHNSDTFEVISESNVNSYGNMEYFKDDKNVYYLQETKDSAYNDTCEYELNIVKDADPSTFKRKGDTYFLTDDMRYYKDGKIFDEQAVQGRNESLSIYNWMLQDENEKGDTIHARSQRYSKVSTLKRTVINMAEKARECHESGGIIKSSAGGFGLMCPDSNSMSSWGWSTLNSCGEQKDSEWIVVYNDSGEWDFTIKCKKYPECSGIENVRCAKDSCVFSEQCTEY